MRKRVLVLGAGFDGLELTTILSDALQRRDWDCSDRQERRFCLWIFKADVMFGKHLPAEVWHAYSAIVKPGVRFVQTAVRSIDPAAKVV
jgi:sulfide:quinone oxidoreductase